MDRSQRVSAIASALVVFLFFTSLLWAQTAGAIQGVVTDEAGEPLEGVTLQVTSLEQGVTGRGRVTTRGGLFQFPSLPSGDDYTITVTLPGYVTVTLSGVVVPIGQVTRVQVVLARETQYEERIEVRGTAEVVSLADATTQTEFSSEFIDSMPILGRNYQDVLAMAPGVSDVDGDGNPNIHGARETNVITLVDGVSTTDPLTGKRGAELNIESIQEIEVKTSGATAEFSRAQGGFANIVTKSGGNEFMGTFKAFYRGSFLDGDGAGADDPLMHAGLGDRELRDLEFKDFLPFLSFEGPIVRDRAWFFTAHEYVYVQDPVNALSNVFVTTRKEFREFAKLTWQASANHRLALSLNYDPQEYLNQGLDSLTREESGYTLKLGGPILTLKAVSVLGPYVSLDTSVSSFEEKPSQFSTLDPDSNGNGRLWFDRNGDGFFQVSESDPGEDYDRDGVYDVFEDINGDGKISVVQEPDPDNPGQMIVVFTEDFDGDDRLTRGSTWGQINGTCEGASREDIDCDGNLDYIDEDTIYCNVEGGDPRCMNGVLDYGEDIDHDGRFDRGIEDRNGDHLLNDRPFPWESKPIDESGVSTSLYPYGRLRPVTYDRLHTLDQQRGVTSGPYFEDFSDRRRRFTFRQDMTVFQPDYWGSHDMKLGWVVERESFKRRSERRPTVAPIYRHPFEGRSTVRALMPSEFTVDNEATALTAGVYFQDNYKPFPNLSIGIGVRFDREATDSFGYSPFDPAAERAQFDRVNALVGSEFNNYGDLVYGNNDGVRNIGIYGDPIFHDLPGGIHSAVGPWVDPVRRAAVQRLTRHHMETRFISRMLSPLFPSLNQGGEIEANLLRDLGIVAHQPEPFRLTNNNLAPRLSISWDPFADGRTKIFATYGRYYDKLFLSTIVGETGPDTINRYYLLDETGVSGNGVPNHNIGATISKAPPSSTQVDRGLQTPWSDEFTFGFEREIAPEMSLSMTYISREFREQLQDIDINHSLRYEEGKTEPIDYIGLVVGNRVDNQALCSGGRCADGRPDLFVHNFFFNQILKVGNFNEARYRGIEVELVKRLSRRWELQGSYTYSRAEGAAEDFQSRLGNDPSTVESEYGPLDFDQRHVVKLNAITFLPRDWQLGFSAGWSSGLPYSIVSRFFALDNYDYQQFRTRYGFTTLDEDGWRFVGKSRNSERNTAVWDFNLRARKTMVLGKTTAGLFIEVFNLLNSDDIRVFRSEPVPPEFQRADGTTAILPLQLDAVRRFGRRFQIGLQFDF